MAPLQKNKIHGNFWNLSKKIIIPNNLQLTTIIIIYKYHYFFKQVEHNLYCNYDWVRVKDSNGTIIKQICGYLEQDLVVYSTNNSMTIQFYTDSAVDGAGFLASWEAIDEDTSEDLFDDKTKQGYVLSFPQAFTVNAETKQDQLCLQMLNLENDGKIKLSIYAAKNLISGEIWKF